MAEKSETQFRELENDPLTHLDESPFARHTDTGGCFTIIGPVQICWKVVGSRIQVCLRLAGIEVLCQWIDTSNPCVTLEGNVLCAKASITVCLEGRCLTYKAVACYRDFPCIGKPWKCTQSSGNIVCF
jgi:hypothetical protein